MAPLHTVFALVSRRLGAEAPAVGMGAIDPYALPSNSWPATTATERYHRRQVDPVKNPPTMEVTTVQLDHGGFRAEGRPWHPVTSMPTQRGQMPRHFAALVAFMEARRAEARGRDFTTAQHWTAKAVRYDGERGYGRIVWSVTIPDLAPPRTGFRGFGAVGGHRGVTLTTTAGVSWFRDPCTGERRVFGASAGGIAAARAAIDAALARGCAPVGGLGDTDADNDAIILRRLSPTRPQNAKQIAHGWNATGYVSVRLRMLADRGAIFRVIGAAGFYLRASG